MPKLIGVMKFLRSIPYENISKAVKRSEVTDIRDAPRLSSELMRAHRELGTGGTCFSLSWYLNNFLNEEGINSRIVMCDRAYGENTHCAVIVDQQDENQRYLLDPGYLSFLPLEIMDNEISRMETPYNSIYLEPEDGKRRYALYTFYKNERKYRFTIKDIPINKEDFMNYWYKSFDAEFMKKPVLTKLIGNKHY
ncbi:MAG: arylamine N-acetyltransferase, partial [bacterium]